MLSDGRWNIELAKLLYCYLFGMRAHDEVNLMSGGIDQVEQALHINRAACAGRANYKFHRRKNCT